MSRANKRITELRAALETIGALAAVVRSKTPVTRLRVSQAQERTGLTRLLSPALDDLDDVSQAVDEIVEQVTSTLAMLME
jgi:hypothetical protein